jgi:phosphatidylethanolamine-binding protein (PEBP) family uncharacterized protein
VSPPLEWKVVPAKSASLLLVVTTVDNSGSKVSWLVGNINPHARGVAEGQIPEGGIVGSNAEGHASYAGVCPHKGDPASTQVVLYALSRQLPLATGFQLAEAQRDWRSGGLLRTAVVKAVNNG